MKQSSLNVKAVTYPEQNSVINLADGFSEISLLNIDVHVVLQPIVSFEHQEM